MVDFAFPVQQEVSEPVLVIYISPGSATAEDIAELLMAISDLYRAMGGIGIDWSVEDARRG